MPDSTETIQDHYISPEFTFSLGDDCVENIVQISSNVIAIISSEPSIYIHRVEEKCTSHLQTFSKHLRRITGLVHLFGDVLCSSDIGGSLFTWNWKAPKNEIIDTNQVGEMIMAPVIKLSETHLAVATNLGEIIIYTHEKGKNLLEQTRLKGATIGSISEMCVYGHEIVVFNENYSASIWEYSGDYSTAKRVGTFRYDGFIGAVVISEQYICTGCWEGTIVVREKGEALCKLKEIDLKPYSMDNEPISIVGLVFLARNVLMVTTTNSGVFFVSLDNEMVKISRYVSRIFPESTEEGSGNRRELYSSTMLSDDRLCVGGEAGYCSVLPIPEEILALAGTRKSLASTKKTIPSSTITAGIVAVPDKVYFTSHGSKYHNVSNCHGIRLAGTISSVSSIYVPINLSPCWMCVHNDQTAVMPKLKNRKKLMNASEIIYQGFFNYEFMNPGCKNHFKSNPYPRHVDGLALYGVCILFGFGFEKDAKLAVDMFRIASKSGCEQATVYLGDCYFEGLGITRDVREAFRLYTNAAQNRSFEGLARVGYCLLHGVGVSRNERSGLHFLLMAAAKGSPLAHSHIADMYRRGVGVNINIKKAIHHLKILAELQISQAHWYLAIIYEREFMFRNSDRAIHHFRCAADSGDDEARHAVSNYFVLGTPPRKMSCGRLKVPMFVRHMLTQVLSSIDFNCTQIRPKHRKPVVRISGVPLHLLKCSKSSLCHLDDPFFNVENGKYLDTPTILLLEDGNTCDEPQNKSVTSIFSYSVLLVACFVLQRGFFSLFATARFFANPEDLVCFAYF